MDDREYCELILWDFGKEVALSTTDLINRQIDEYTYMEQSKEQVKRYVEALLAWKNQI